ncbi:MAG: hypothetical protein U0325_24180 [Polyangiales bacterium]
MGRRELRRDRGRDLRGRNCGATAGATCVGGNTCGVAAVGGIVGATEAAPHRGQAAPGEGAANASAQRGQ